MPLVVGVSFKKVGKVYYFDPSGLDLHEGDLVIVETARGAEFSQVMIEPREVSEEEIVPPLKKIIRKATENDIEREEANRQKEKRAFSICQEKVHTHNLPMKLIDSEYCFDGSQVTFFFSADSRVDFRELVKDLAGALKTKVQLHQVGVRDEAKLFGGMGPCGRVLCCSSFLSGFDPVSMKMAKEQSLFLNPLKFSGTCGKLMCCLKFEYHMYKEVKSRLPAIGSIVMTKQGRGRVLEIDVIKETMSIALETESVAICTMDDIVQGDGHCPAAQGKCGGCHSEQVGVNPDDAESEPKQANEQNNDSPPAPNSGRRRHGNGGRGDRKPNSG